MPASFIGHGHYDGRVERGTEGTGFGHLNSFTFGPSFSRCRMFREGLASNYDSAILALLRCSFQPILQGVIRLLMVTRSIISIMAKRTEAVPLYMKEFMSITDGRGEFPIRRSSGKLHPGRQHELSVDNTSIPPAYFPAAQSPPQRQCLRSRTDRR